MPELNAETLEKILRFMQDYTEKTGTDTNLYTNLKTGTLQINTVDRTSFISVNYYLTIEEASAIEYPEFEHNLNFIAQQEAYRRKDVYAKNVFQDKEQ